MHLIFLPTALLIGRFSFIDQDWFGISASISVTI